MSYNIKVTHTAPTFKQFAEWGVQQAYPTFYLNICFHNKETDMEVLSFKVKIEGHYYCCGSRNFEDISMELAEYKKPDSCVLPHDNISNEEIENLLGYNGEMSALLQNIIEESIKDSMIPNDPIGILELIWDELEN
jgi:hypothetical protein